RSPTLLTSRRPASRMPGTSRTRLLHHDAPLKSRGSSMNAEDPASGRAGEPGAPRQSQGLSRRRLMTTAGAAATAFTIVPRHVLGGAGFVAPSEKITLACIGFGTQAIREIGGILASPDVQVVAVCDVEKDGANYLEWGKNGIRNLIRQLIGSPTWR